MTFYGGLLLHFSGIAPIGGVVPLRGPLNACFALSEARQGFVQYLRPFPNAKSRGMCHSLCDFSAITERDSAAMAPIHLGTD